MPVKCEQPLQSKFVTVTPKLKILHFIYTRKWDDITDRGNERQRRKIQLLDALG